MTELRIERLGPTHLRKGVSATWNIGLKRNLSWRKKLGVSRAGKPPWNKGKGRILFLCEVCGKEVFDKPYRKSRTCSKICKDKLLKIYRGEAHWNFKGEASGTRQRRRSWSEYREWRSLIMARDNYTCTKCDRRGGRLTAHHLQSWSKFPELRFSVENGAALCWKCHWQYHRKFGHKTFSPLDYVSWISTPTKVGRKRSAEPLKNVRS